jgi:hypothetical protein
MRPSIKRPFTGLLVVGALALSAVGAEAMGGNANGPDAYIGIIGGSPQRYIHSANGVNQGYDAQAGHYYPNGYGQYDRDRYNGY